MDIHKLVHHLNKKNLSKPTDADPTIPPSLNLPEGEESEFDSSKIDLGKMLNPKCDGEIEDGDWLDRCEIRVPEWTSPDFDNSNSGFDNSENVHELGGKNLDVAGWYCPFHFYEEDYGIYIKSETIRKNTVALISCMTNNERSEYHHLSPSDKRVFSHEIKRAAFLSIFNHEMYHHCVESFATRIEMVDENAYFVNYNTNIFKRYQNPLNDNLIEEALAKAYPLKYFRQTSGKLFKKIHERLRIEEIVCRFEFLKVLHCNVPGYRGAKNLIKSPKGSIKVKKIGISANEFGLLERMLQQTVIDCQYPPKGDNDNWLYSPLMMKPYFNRDVIAYEVLDSKSSAVLPQSVNFLQLSPKKALRIARKKWGIETDGYGRGDHIKVKLPVSNKRIDFDIGYGDIPTKEWKILIEGMNERLGTSYRNNEKGRRKFVQGP
jgi:hypothetical protein